MGSSSSFPSGLSCPRMERGSQFADTSSFPYKTQNIRTQENCSAQRTKAQLLFYGENPISPWTWTVEYLMQPFPRSFCHSATLYTKLYFLIYMRALCRRRGPIRTRPKSVERLVQEWNWSRTCVSVGIKKSGFFSISSPGWVSFCWTMTFDTCRMVKIVSFYYFLEQESGMAS